MHSGIGLRQSGGGYIGPLKRRVASSQEGHRNGTSIGKERGKKCRLLFEFSFKMFTCLLRGEPLEGTELL